MTLVSEAGSADGRLAAHYQTEDRDPSSWFNHRVITRYLRESDRAEYVAAFMSEVRS